jgi:hypothetical protein
MKPIQILNLLTTPLAFFIMLIIWCIPAHYYGYSKYWVLVFFGLILFSFVCRRLVNSRE